MGEEGAALITAREDDQWEGWCSGQTARRHETRGASGPVYDETGLNDRCLSGVDMQIVIVILWLEESYGGAPLIAECVFNPHAGSACLLR